MTDTEVFTASNYNLQTHVFFFRRGHRLFHRLQHEVVLMEHSENRITLRGSLLALPILSLRRELLEALGEEIRLEEGK